MHIGIVGAGVSGLVSAKHCLAAGHRVTVFEKHHKLGGCWSGDAKSTGLDEYGLPINYGMYQDLRTNLPKEIMVLEGLEHDANLEKSYVSQQDILSYLQRYATKFDLERHIEFLQEVINVEPIMGSATRWRISVRDVRTKHNNVKEEEFDALLIGSGHFNKKYVAPITDADRFAGLKMHSNDYRNPDVFRNLRVIVIGAGPSAGDIAKRVSAAAAAVFQSVKADSPRFVPIYKDVKEKCEIDRFDERGAHFKNGTYELADAVIYSTGYTYSLPFLSENCGLKVDNNWIQYLHQHCVNIEYPTMFIVGLPYGASIYPMIDLQLRYFLAYTSGKFTLPKKEEMLKQVLDEWKERKSRGEPKKNFHTVKDAGRSLSAAMAKEASIKGTPNVVFNIMDALHAGWNDKDKFTILDDDNFTRVAFEQMS